VTVCFSNLDVQFFWVLVKPHCHVFGADCNNSNAAPHERVQDVDSPFSVEPEIGVLPALATLSFTVQRCFTFCILIRSLTVLLV